jgi:hypothetical protein
MNAQDLEKYSSAINPARRETEEGFGRRKRC